MCVLLCSIILASMTYSVNAMDIEDDLTVYMPLSLNPKEIPECPPNEMHSTCVGNCSDCTQRGMCTITKCVEGCDCIPRFYRITPGGPCEPVANCPYIECGENEVFRECGPICERCSTVKCHVISCEHKCYCKEGYLRNEEGKCILAEDCPKRKRCSRREEWAKSGPVDEFCPIGKNDTPNNETQEVEQCYCIKGHKRTIMGYCTAEEHCHSSQCPGFEVYHDCVPNCNTTCRNYGKLDCIEDGNCYSGCFCKSGYVMNDYRACIPIEECPLDIEKPVLAMKSSEIIVKDNSTYTTQVSENSTDTTVVYETSTDTTSVYETSTSTTVVFTVSTEINAVSTVSTDTTVGLEVSSSTSINDAATKEYSDKSLASNEQSSFTESGQMSTTENSLTIEELIVTTANEKISTMSSSESSNTQAVALANTNEEDDLNNEQL